MSLVYMQAQKDWQEFRRDRLSIALSFLLPLITLVLFGYGIRLQAHDLKISVEDSSKSAPARALFERLQASYLLRPVLMESNSLEDSLKLGKSKATMVIPADLQKSLLLAKTAKLQILIDGTDIVNGRFVQSAIYGASAGGAPTAGAIHCNKHILFNPGLNETLFVVPGVYGIVFWIFPCLLSCVAIAREKEQGSLVHITISSMRSYEYVLGKGLVYWFLAMAQATLVLLTGFLMFGIRFCANPIPFCMSVPLFLATAVLFGLAIGAWSKSQTSAVQAVSSLAFFTSLLLSGFIYPLENIPGPFSWISYLVPARYFIEISRDAFSRGMGWTACLQNMCILATFFFVLLCVAVSGCKRFKARNL